MRASSEDHRLLDDNEKCDEIHGTSYTGVTARSSRIIVLLLSLTCVMLTFSVGVNIFQSQKAAGRYRLPVTVLEAERTRFAGLTWNTPRIFEVEDAYDHENETLRNAAWQAINYDRGSVALDFDYAERMGLPKAQPFPWDDSKGLYFISAFHSLHCLKILHRTIYELRHGLPLGFVYSHSMHCLDVLRQDVLCFADDTPLYSSFEHVGSPGVDQGRQCRDWSKLEAFANEHTSCWKDIQPTEQIDTLLRYRYCPPGSPYVDRIHQIFGDFEDPDNKTTSAQTH